MMNVMMMMMMMFIMMMMMICNTCFNHMYFAVLDPLKYIVFCGLRNYDELSSKPVSIHEKLFKCACSNLCVNFEKNIVLTVKLLYLNSTKACYNIQG